MKQAKGDCLTISHQLNQDLNHYGGSFGVPKLSLTITEHSALNLPSVIQMNMRNKMFSFSRTPQIKKTNFQVSFSYKLKKTSQRT